MRPSAEIAVLTQPIALLVWGYLALTLSVALCVAIEARLEGRLSLARVGSSSLSANALRVSLALQLCALAGLPPAVYFFAKLGLLAAVVGCGQVTLVAALAVAIALAWLVYLRAGLTLLQQLTVLPATPLRRTLLPVAAFSLLIFLVCVALVGGFFLDDLGLLAARVSGR